MYVEKDYHLIYVEFAAFYGTYVSTYVECHAGAPVAFKTWCGHQYREGIICLVEIGLRWLPKLGVDTSPRPHVHRRACHDIDVNEFCT